MVEANKEAIKASTAEKKDPETKKDTKKKDEDPDEDLSDEDKALKLNLETCVETLKGPDPELYKPALESLRSLIRASTTSMTSVPKPLKFMKPHYDTMKQIHSTMSSDTSKKFCAQIISVLAMTNREGRDCLEYRLLADPAEPIGDWGHEYVRHLASEITVEWEKSTDQELLYGLCKDIVPYHMEHNAEAEACDLLMEVERLDMLIAYIDEAAYPRVCLYLTSCVPYVPEPENTNLLRIALQIYEKFNQYPQALRTAMQLNDMKVIERLLFKCPDKSLQKQLAYMIGRQQITLETPEDEEEDEDLVDIMSNSHLNNNFLSLARELDILEPKTPDDIYKSHMEGSGRTPFGGAQPDSAKQNLASSFVNGFVNAAFGKDKLLMPAEDGNKWLYKNKDHGMLSATASLGLILLWDVDGGLTQIDKYLYSAQDHIKSGALLACGLVNCGVRNECDPALALLTDYVLHPTNIMRIGSILGLGLAYAGSNRADVIALLLQPFNDSRSDMEIIGIAALACGMVAVGSENKDVTTTIVTTLSEKSTQDLKDTYARFLPLGLGLCYLGRQEGYEVHVAVLETLPDPFKSMAKTMVEICAYAGTGNVLKIQEFLKICSEHYEPASDKEEKKDDKKEKKDKEKEGSSGSSTTAATSSEGSSTPSNSTAATVDLGSQQAVAVLGIALLAMSEDIGTEMALRPFGHLLRYCEPVIRRAVPLALGLLSVSNPKINIIETLSKFSHDADAEVAHNAIFAMGLVGAGTNNARLASMLRQLATYHAKDVNNLFMVRIAQGLTHLGKGTLTLHPYHNDRQLMSPVAMAGLISTAVCFLDVKNIILGKSHYLLYLLVAAMQPRMLVTLDEELKPLPVSVRVGQAVDVVGAAGKPKTITGFQTHSTPVLLAHGERAELATDEYLSLTPNMEGFVILKKNPDYQEI